MNQSKLRGTFEQRKAQSIIRQERERQERLAVLRLKKIEDFEQERARMANMAPEELKAESERKMKAAHLMAIGAGLAPNHFLFRTHNLSLKSCLIK